MAYSKPDAGGASVPEVRNLRKLQAELERDMSAVRASEARLKALGDFGRLLDRLSGGGPGNPGKRNLGETEGAGFSVTLTRVASWDNLSPAERESVTVGPFDLTGEARDGLLGFIKSRREAEMRVLRDIEAKYAVFALDSDAEP